MKSINEYLDNEMVVEGIVNKMELLTIIIFCGMYMNYRNTLKPETIKFVEEKIGEDKVQDILDTLSYWDDNDQRKSYNALYKLYGEEILNLAEYSISISSTKSEKKSWEKIKSEIEKFNKK